MRDERVNCDSERSASTLTCQDGRTPFGVRTLEAALDLRLLYAPFRRDTEREGEKAQPTPAASGLIHSGVEPPHSKKGRYGSEVRLLTRTFPILLCALLPLHRAEGHSLDRSPADLVTRIDAALARASRFLVKRQATDGASRSDTYGIFKDGPSLTPLVLNTLYFMPPKGSLTPAAFRKGVDYLARMAGPDG